MNYALTLHSSRGIPLTCVLGRSYMLLQSQWGILKI